MKEHLNPASQSRRRWWVRGTGLAALAAVFVATLVLYQPALDEWRWRTVLATSGEERGQAVQRLIDGGSERTIQALLRRMRRELHAPAGPVPDTWPRCEFRGGLPAGGRPSWASVGPDARAAAPALEKLLARSSAEPVRSMVTRAIDSLNGILDCREGDHPHTGFGAELKRRRPRQGRRSCQIHGAALREDVVPISYGLTRHPPSRSASVLGVDIRDRL